MPEAGDVARLDGAQRNLVGAVPAAVVAHGDDLVAAGIAAAGEFRDTAGLAEVLRQRPRPVARRPVEAEQQRAAGEFGRGRAEDAVVRVLPHGDVDPGCRGGASIGNAGGAGGREIAFLRVVGALAVVNVVHELVDQEVDVRVALAVGVRRHVDRHAVHVGREVGAVVEVEAAQEVLVRLAVTAVLGHDQAWNDLEHLAGPEHRPALDLHAGDDALAGRERLADESDARRGHDDFLERHALRRAGRDAGGAGEGGRAERDWHRESRGAQRAPRAAPSRVHARPLQRPARPQTERMLTSSMMIVQ